jgi:hypothetical protein
MGISLRLGNLIEDGGLPSRLSSRQGVEQLRGLIPMVAGLPEEK